jgi:hypothetical protein
MPEERTVLQIRCRVSTKVAFKQFAARFRNYEEALLYLLEKEGVYVRRFVIK